MSAGHRRFFERMVDKDLPHLFEGELTRTRDAIQFDVVKYGSRVVLVFTPEHVAIRLVPYERNRPLPHVPAGSRLWKRLELSPAEGGHSTDITSKLLELVDEGFRNELRTALRLSRRLRLLPSLPSGEAPRTEPSSFEQVATSVRDAFSGEMARTRDLIQLDIEGDRGVVLLFTPEHVEIRLPTVDWTQGAYGPAASSRLWKRRRLSGFLGDAPGVNPKLAELIRKGISLRQKEFRECRFCRESLPPEHMHEDVCHGCAEKHLGVVH